MNDFTKLEKQKAERFSAETERKEGEEEKISSFSSFLYKHIPHRWLNQKAKGTKRLFEGLGESIEYVNGFAEMLKRNNQTRKVTELITELENEYGITVNPSYDLDFRRERIIAKIRMQDSPVTKEDLIAMLEGMGFYDCIVEPLIGKFQIKISMKVPEKYRYKVAEIQQLLEENIRAHIGIGWETISETPFYHALYIEGAVFSPVVETVLPEIEQYYDFVIPMNVACGCWTVMDTVLTELESD